MTSEFSRPLEDSQGLTFARVKRSLQTVQSSTERRLNEWCRELKTHEMGVQISRGIHSEVPEEIDLRVGMKGTGADYTGTGSSEGYLCGGGALDVRPRARAVIGSTEVFGRAGGRVYQG